MKKFVFILLILSPTIVHFSSVALLVKKVLTTSDFFETPTRHMTVLQPALRSKKLVHIYSKTCSHL